MNHIFLDLECTCWKKGHDRSKMETIEIGAIKVDAQFTALSEYDRFVRPTLYPELSPFCVQLTSITQEDVDRAAPFPAVWADFLAWIGPGPIIWYSWGQFDINQLTLDLGRAELPWSDVISPKNYRNLKRMYAAWREFEEPVGMMKALRQLEIRFEGRHHRAIDDARHMRKIAAAMQRANAF